MRGDRALVHDEVRLAHEALAVFHVAGKFRERVHHPELGERQPDGPAFPRRAEALRVELERPALEHFLGRFRLAQRIDPAKQRRDAREQVRQAHVLGEIVVRAQAQARDRVEVGVARSEKKDRQAGGQGAQLAAQREAPVGLLAQADVDHGEIGEPRPEGAHRLAARRVRAHLVAVLPERVRVVGADCGVVFDDGDAARHGDLAYPLLS